MSTYTVAVRALCEFAARRGDLDLRFTPAPTAREGIQGHALAAARRGPGYEAEVALDGEHEELRVRGRADGWDAGRRLLVEVKTHRGRLDRQPANHRALHWAQARLYGWLMCRREGLEEISLALVYVDVDTRDETVLEQRCSAAELRKHFERCCSAFLGWARQELRHRAARDAALAALQFPHAGFRAGQRDLAAAVWRAARSGRCLLAQAPTGIGKTVATLFPMLKAAPAERLDRVIFLTAKTSGRALALDAMATLRSGDATWPVRTLELVARDKACVHPDRACHGDSCPLARGFHDRLPAARDAAVRQPTWDKAAVAAIAAEHAVCPYFLAQELARWADVIVGDHNHWFDASALLHGLAQADDRRVGLLVDEAHNLVGRARAMYSASLDAAALKALRRTVPPPVSRALETVRRRYKALANATDGSPAAAEAVRAPLTPALYAQAGRGSEGNRGLRAPEAAFRVLDAPPTALLAALQKACAAIGEHLAEQPPEPDGPLQSFWFDALHLLRLAESFGPHSMFDLQPGDGRDGGVLWLRNIVPAGFLAPRFAAAHTTTLFSATLQPEPYFRDMLGLPADTAWLDVASPFHAAQLAVHVDRGLSTRWRDRDASLDRVVERMARQYAARPGNYLAFFGSYDYLDRAADAFAARHAGVPVWRQSRGMSEAEQAAFLARFAEGGRGIGFAVLGGSFGEGVDLPGERLVGAFIATLGLPAASPLNEEIRRRLGFDYTYLVPGLQKVVQAAGRVIRTPEDRGVLHLMDERYAQRAVRALLPAWWRLQG